MLRLDAMLLGGCVTVVACGGGGSGPSSPSPASTTTTTTSASPSVYANLVYTSAPRPFALDLYVPSSSTPASVIVYLHGADGTKEGGGAANLVFNQRLRGYAVASVEYSTPGVLFPASVQDCKAAIRWLRANAAKYNLNPNKIGVWGTSYGAYMGGFLGAAGGVSALEDLGQGSASESSLVQAVVSWAGFFDVTPYPSEAWVNTMLGCSLTACPDRWSAASPITYVDSTDAPFLFVHGGDDTTVSSSQSSAMHEKLIAAGVSSSLVILPGVRHTGPWSASATGPTEAFLDKYLQ